MKLACVTTCRGRVHHLKQTLPANIHDAHGQAIFIVLDYNDQDGLHDYIMAEHQADIAAGRLIYYRNSDAPRFHMAHAKNQAHRCAIMEGATHLVTLDADNLTGPGFVDWIHAMYETDPGLSYLAPDFASLPPKGHRFNKDNPVRLGRGFAGRLVIRAQDFLKAGGYNETYDTWRGEDIDLIARLKRMRLIHRAIPATFLNAIAHSQRERFREYPDAEKYEAEDVFATAANNHDTVVNFGQIGVGTVYRKMRNMDECGVFITPAPTRVFGIGMQRTGTTSLDAALASFGFDTGHWKSGTWAKSIFQEMNRWGRSVTLEHDYALTDNPIPMLYQKLDQSYPGSKFILTLRPEAEWIASMEKFWTYEGNPHRWTWDEDGFSHRMHSMLYGTPEFDRERMLARYRQHNAEVINYFLNKPGQLLVIDVGKDTMMNALCEYLGQPVQHRPFPHRNKGDSNVLTQRRAQAPQTQEAPPQARPQAAGAGRQPRLPWLRQFLGFG